jgi:hypothetical protein
MNAGPVAASYAPYVSDAPNAIYGLLFCDDLAAFAPRPGAAPAPWQTTLFAAQPDAAKVETLARDDHAESRVRALAYYRLRTHGHAAAKGVLLGVVVEVPLDGGLDVMAAYADGSVRYIDHTGRIAVVEPGSLAAATPQVVRLMELAKPIVAAIGPWDKPRLPPPVRPNLRLSFIVSDGLYFGEGPMAAMQKDKLAGPVFQQATALLMTVTGAGSGKPAD